MLTLRYARFLCVSERTRINVIPSILHYHGKITDAPCMRLPKAHPKTTTHSLRKSSRVTRHISPTLCVDVRGEEEARARNDKPLQIDLGRLPADRI
jgi:hypothetical protein